MAVAPCKYCDKKGCGSYHDNCSAYQEYRADCDAYADYRSKLVPKRPYGTRIRTPERFSKCHKK